MVLASVPVDPAALARVQANVIPPGKVDRSKRTLFVQYFIPSFLQTAIYHHFEWLLTWLNQRFYMPRGDAVRGRCHGTGTGIEKHDGVVAPC